MIKYAPIDIDKVRNLIVDVQKSVLELEKLVGVNLENFKEDPRNYGLAEHYFRRSLEAILTIGSHIISRLPAKTKDYQEIIVSLGELGIIPRDFAENNKKLAGYRNRLVHMYWEISPEELFNVIKDHLADLDKFCLYFQEALKNPEKFGLVLE